jgi:hypothetical protein
VDVERRRDIRTGRADDGRPGRWSGSGVLSRLPPFRRSDASSRSAQARAGWSGPRTWLSITAFGLIVVVAAGGWLVWRGRQAQRTIVQLEADGSQLQRQLDAYDLRDAGPTLTRVRVESQRAHRLTGDPVWRVGGLVPVLGRNIRAARQVSATLADITTAARPLETALPQLDPRLSSNADGRVNTVALSQIAAAMPDLSAAVSAGAVTVNQLNPAHLQPQIASGVVRLNAMLGSSRGPLANAVPVLQMVPAMLGADGQRQWMVLLQQDAEARGTGGLVGAFAVLTTDQGRITLKQAASRATLDRGPAIPAGFIPSGVRAVYREDLTEWSDFNASPDFAYTGELVNAGWNRRKDSTPLNYVAGIDQYGVAGLLAATGPVSVRGVKVDSGNAVDFLSRGIYARWSNPHTVDDVTTALVQEVFRRFAAGRFDLRSLVTAMREPIAQRRVLLWAADQDEQAQLAQLSVSGALPSGPGAFAMAVVNNGGGNKLDAYLKVHTGYQGGRCYGNTRVGQIQVTLDNTAPRNGLPAYVDVRSDLVGLGYTGEQTHNGSNRVILEIYGPVGSTAALTTLDGKPLAPALGTDNNHTVWRVAVLMNAGQRRTVNVVMTAPAVDGDAGTRPVVLTQPMVKPATVSTTPLSSCDNSSVTGG